MCYAAEIQADHERLVREFGAVIDIHGFSSYGYARTADPEDAEAIIDAFRGAAKVLWD